MTKKECAIVSAYTGILCGDVNEFHKYAEELLGRPIWTHEFADKNLWKTLKELSKNDFCNLGKEDTKQDLTPLQALKELKYVHDTECGEDKTVNERFALIETALKDYETLKINYSLLQEGNRRRIAELEENKKQLKALKILKQCVVKIDNYPYKDRTDYVIFFGGFEGECSLNKEEYELLKEILK